MKATNKKPVQKPLPQPKPKPEIKQPSAVSKQYLFWGLLASLFIISILAFSPMLKNGFISTWDDSIYVIQNKLLPDLSWQGIVNIFSYGDDLQKQINNYHPITILSLALNYKFSGLSPASYHITNMVFHSFNALLVYLFTFYLSRRRILPAIISGLLFALHPMHVESVAWVSERKDVLYTFFFLGGLISYLKYLEDEKTWKLAVAFLLFLFSCLSKAMAVPFPIILLLIDYLNRRNFSWKLIVEKIPFFGLALVIGWMSVHLQAISAINKFETFTFYQRIMHASFGFVTYIQKFFFPGDLSAFYPYPAITSTGFLPLQFRVAPFVCLAIVVLLILLAIRKKEMPRIMVFGILFYFFTIALVLQFLSVGLAIMAERYTYIPYIGLVFIIGMVADFFIQKKSSVKYVGWGLSVATGILCLVFFFKTNDRTKVWKNDISLWSDVLEQYTDGRVNFIYEKRAEKYLEKDEYEAALSDYLAITTNNPSNTLALESIGRIYGKYYNDLGKAIEYLEKAYSTDPKNPIVLSSLGVAMGIKGDFTKSLDYLLQAYELNNSDTSLMLNISASYKNLGMTEKAKLIDRQIEALRTKKGS
jgi:hypothetical protein